MTKSNALYWQGLTIIQAASYIGLPETVTTVTTGDNSFEIIDGNERYLIEIRCFDISQHAD